MVEMKQVKTLADLIAMQPRERDAWFAERFGWRWVRCEDYKALAAPDSEYMYCPDCTLDEIEKLPIYEDSAHPYYSKSPNGSFALKAEMVKLGYEYTIQYAMTIADDKEPYYCIFEKTLGEDNGSHGVNEIEATWKAAALALLGE